MKQKPEMKSMLVAVFGHYDSRGGTTAMLLDDRTPAAVTRAMKRYNVEVFGVEEAHQPIKTTVYGMEARVADQAAHGMMHGDSTPAEDDFMYVAELHYPDGIDLSGDLEEPDGKGMYRRVLKSGGENGERADTDRYGWKLDVEKKGTPEFPYEQATHESLVRESLTKPVQLEAVMVKELPTPADVLEAIERCKVIQQEKPLFTRPKEVPYDEWNSQTYWGDPEYKDLQDKIGMFEGHSHDWCEKAVVKAARVIKDPSTARWDDDAFGFVLI